MPYDYTQIGAADGAIVVPDGSLDRWFAYRDTLGAARREVVVFGDSTTWGSGGLYSWLQRLRDRAVTYGMDDGGKGIFGAAENQITYDSPEVNGYVSSTATGATDNFDNLDGSFFFDDGSPSNAELVLQFRSSAARLWYVRRSSVGEFTYQVNDEDPVVVDAYKTGTGDYTFVYLSGYDPTQTHTLTITGTGVAGFRVALAPVNDTGIAIQKHARSGGTIFGTFFNQQGVSPWTGSVHAAKYLSALGLEQDSPSSPYTGVALDTRYSESARIKPVLAMTMLGFNDLTNASTYEVAMWDEYVKKFAAACSDADCDGIVLSGQLPYNAQWPTYGQERFEALRDGAVEHRLGFVDMFYPVAGHALDYAGGTTNPHLSRSQYEDQADFLWDNVLGADVSTTPAVVEAAVALAASAAVAVSGRRVVGRSLSVSADAALSIASMKVASRSVAISAAAAVSIEGGRPIGRARPPRTREGVQPGSAARGADRGSPDRTVELSPPNPRRGA